MFDLLGEIMETMRRNRMRTFLTGFAVAWGIFMLIVLLSAGQGLQNGVRSNFQGRAINSVSISPGWTSMPYKGYRADRAIRFDERTVEFIRSHVPEVEYLSAELYRSTQSVAYGEEYGTWRILASMPDVIHIDYMTITKGRFLNEVDQKAKRKVVVLNGQAERTLFPDGESLGKYIIADGIAFQVIGVYDTPEGQTFNPPIYIPLSTGRQLFDRGWGIGSIDFTVTGIDTEAAADELVERIRALLGPYLGFDPADKSALWVWNSAKMAAETQQVFNFINIFLWVIGFASIMAGVVGVANIMLVTVRERTREIGIRKAIGATPWSIIKMVIIEAVFITTVAGYIGIMLGLGLTELISRGLSSAPGGGDSITMFKDPTVGLGIVFAVLGILVACGVVAGLIPSLRATRIRPIEAMRAD
ncbi:MAG: ABC transporter permease [Alistipes sp.]|jgi:putative ABC transport system permease protein|nr:ABC transporter permease [Alistipes sp.]